jgi:hypothetical protein
VKKILSPTTALLDHEYTAYSSQSISQHTYTAFDNSSFTLDYEATPVYYETENSQSFAYIQIEDLEPATGDVSRIKVFTNNNGTIGSWDLVNDVELQETEIFVSSTASLLPDTSIGIFTSQSIINTYWEAAAYQSATVLTTPTLTWITASISNAMKITTTSLTERNQVAIAKIKSQYAGVFIEKSAYKVTLDALCESAGTLSIYLSGSGFFEDSTDYFNQEFTKTFGKRVGEITGITDQRFDDYVFSFESDYTGTGVLILVIESGAWQVADIKTTSDNDSGYSPNYTRIKTPIATTHKIGNQLSFKFEYYNVNGEKSKQISYIYNKDWEGGNRYIDGNYSMLTGSLYVADSLNSGIGISGYTNAGFIRSLGYEGLDVGYPGFLIWSGSALPGQTSKGQPYSGVGIELYANTSSYFRYSTTDSEIDVRTDKFFFGQYPAPFISGANGNIEISASNFHLSREGNVTASNALFTGVALANIIRDKTVTITAANSGSYFQTYDIEPGPGTTNGTRIVMDGTLGGEIIRRVRLNVAPPYPIADFKLPSLSSTAKLDITVETNISNVEFYDIFIPGKSTPALYPPPTVALDSNAVITLVAGGTTGASWLTTAGTEHPFDHIFKNDVYITGSGANRLVIAKTGSDAWINFSTSPTAQWSIGIDTSDADSFNISTAASLTTGANRAIRIDTSENVKFAGNVEITGSVALGGIANAATAYGLYYNPTSKQVTYGASGSGGGGGGTPGGSDTQIQYNSAGAFAGVPVLTWDGTTLRGTGSFTGSLTGIATSGSSILVSNTPSTAGTYYPVFVSNSSGYGTPRVDTSTFTYDTTTNTLTVTASYASTASYSANLQISGSVNNVDYIDFTKNYIIGTNAPAWKEGRLFYDSGSGALAMYNWEADVTLNIGQEQWLRARNQTGVTITNGSLVKLDSAIGDRPTVTLAQAVDQTNTFSTGNEIIGMATHDIEHGTDGFITTFGLVNGVNTAAFNAGDLLWVSQSAGQYTNIPPAPPLDRTFVGIVTRKNVANGTVFMTPLTPIHFHDISSVSASVYTMGDLWMYRSGSVGQANAWINTKALTGSYTISGSLQATSLTGSFSGSVAAPGATTQIVFNNGGVLGATSSFVYSGSRVGIGTITPTNTLDIVSTTTGSLRISGSAGSQITMVRPTAGLFGYVRYLGSNMDIGTNGSDPLRINTANVTRINILETGLVGIGLGVLTPTSLLQVRGTGATSATTALRVENSSAVASLIVLDNGQVGLGASPTTGSFDVRGTTVVGTNSGGTLTGIGINFNPTISSSGNFNTLIGLNVAPLFHTGSFTNQVFYPIIAGGFNVNERGWVQTPRIIATGDTFINVLDFNAAAGMLVRNLSVMNVGYWFANGHLRLANEATYVDNGYRFQINSSGSVSGSLYITGSSNQTLLEIDSPILNNILFVSGSGRVGIGTNLPTTTLDISGSGRFTNGLTVTGSLIAPNITGSLLGTASYATNHAVVPSLYICQGQLSADQTIPDSSDTVIEFVDDFDPQNWWNATTFIFNPKIAGYYNLNAGAWLSQPGVDNRQGNLQMRKNGSTIMIVQQQLVINTGQSFTGGKLVYLNGTTDYIDFTMYQGSGAALNIQQGTTGGSGTWFSAHLVTM